MKTIKNAAMAVGALIAVGGLVFAMKYDDWVVSPKLIAQKRAYVVQQLRDPATVQFKDEHLTKQGWLCGELNGKNAYGAYVGFKRFISRADEDAWIEDSGYAGKPGAQSTAQILEGMDAKIKVSERFLEAKKKDNDLEIPSSKEFDSLAEKELFVAHWKKHCT